MTMMMIKLMTMMMMILMVKMMMMIMRMMMVMMMRPIPMIMMMMVMRKVFLMMMEDMMTMMIMMVKMVKMMMLMMGEPGPRIVMLGSGSPAASTRKSSFLIVTGAGEPDPNMTLGALLHSTVSPIEFYCVPKVTTTLTST